MLPFGPERMLQRVVRLLGEAAAPVIVVAAAGQELPELPAEVAVIRDRRARRGPLEGIACGLAALESRARAAYITSCDAALLVPGFVRRVVELWEGYDVAVPCVGGFCQPLAAVYGMAVRPHVEALLAADRLRPAFLFDRVPTRQITAEELREADAELESLVNVNSPGDYSAALARARVVA
jgi:molybdopterin-guanine dinucleotide biosynthesis protein A